MLWQVQNTITETSFIGPNVEAALPVNFRCNMAQISATLKHLEAPHIMKYSTQGCKVSYMRECTKREMAATVHIGPHPSARTPDAISVFQKGN